MGKKADADHTPEQPPLDDDPRWLPIEDAHQRRNERTGSNRLAAADLTKEQAQRHVRSMARSLRSGEPRRVAPAEWVDEIELLFWKNRPRVFSRRPSVRMIARRPTRVREQVRDWAFYVWKPDFETVWPPPPDTSSEAPSRPPVRIPRRSVGRPFALTPQEIKTGIAMVRRADRKHRQQYPKQKLKIGAALKLLRDNMKRDGKPINVSDTVWKEQVVWPVLRPDKKTNNN
jgi:hypothetical protein